MEEVVTLWHKLNFRQGDEWLGVGRYDCLNLEISPVKKRGTSITVTLDEDLFNRSSIF